VNPARHPDRPTSLASITITSTAALSTSTTTFSFRDLPCHSLAHPRASHLPQKTPCPSSLRVKPPRAIPARPTSRASITITSTAALSTSTTLFPFRDLPCHSVAPPPRVIPLCDFAPLRETPAAFHSRQNLRALRVFVLNPLRAILPVPLFRDHPCHSVAICALTCSPLS
jgi:hypothetical protein